MVRLGAAAGGAVAGQLGQHMARVRTPRAAAHADLLWLAGRGSAAGDRSDHPRRARAAAPIPARLGDYLRAADRACPQHADIDRAIISDVSLCRVRAAAGDDRRRDRAMAACQRTATPGTALVSLVLLWSLA